MTTVLINNNTNNNSSSSPSPTPHMQAAATSTMNATFTGGESFDTNDDTKTEFYTREGLWTLVTNGEYVRQQQQTIYQQQQQMQTANGQNVNANIVQPNFNEPVKIMTFKYFKFDDVKKRKQLPNVCANCSSKFAIF